MPKYYVPEYVPLNETEFIVYLDGVEIYRSLNYMECLGVCVNWRRKHPMERAGRIFMNTSLLSLKYEKGSSSL